MKKLFVALTIACLGTILASISANAAVGLGFDETGNPLGWLSMERAIFLRKAPIRFLNSRPMVRAKKNAQENPTNAADKEVTRMTLDRTTELEKRLKKAK